MLDKQLFLMYYKCAYAHGGYNMMNQRVAVILEEKCIGCERCISSCPFGAIEMKEGKAVVNEALCRGCMRCQRPCPTQAIVRK